MQLTERKCLFLWWVTLDRGLFLTDNVLQLKMWSSCTALVFSPKTDRAQLVYLRLSCSDTHILTQINHSPPSPASSIQKRWIAAHLCLVVLCV